MNRLDHILAAMGLQRRPQRQQPRPAPTGGFRYKMGKTDRLNSDWHSLSGTGDFHIGMDHCTMVQRARELERENDYARRYLNSSCNNVLGADGLSFQNKAYRENGLLDKIANTKIEEGWRKWGRKQNCTISRDLSWREVQHLGLRSTIRDGAYFWRIVEGADNPFGFALEILEIDQLDTSYNSALPNGNMVCMGVEKDKMNRVVAYHMFEGHPGNPWDFRGRKRVRKGADKVKQYFVKERISQSVGVTWFCSAGQRMHHLEKYEEAEVIAARQGAEKGGWFRNERGDQFEGDDTEQETHADGTTSTNALTDFEPGQFDELPPGTEFIPYTPNHPNTSFGPFTTSTLRGIAAGLNIDYATLTNDLSEANYSSMRSGKLESQETWKGIQGHFIENFALEVFEAWLPFAMLSKQVNLPLDKIDQFNKPVFRGRRWPWVDPSKDVDAAIKSIDHGLESHSAIVAQNGNDLEDIIDDAKEKKMMLEEAGIEFATGTAPAKPQKADSKEDPEAE